MPKQAFSIEQVLGDQKHFRIPRIVAFNRLETRPRTVDFTRSLRAEIRDPLWMLTRQWQFGEFEGEDAASAVTSRISYQHETLDRVEFRDESSFVFDKTMMPLETRVERERIPLVLRESSAEEIYSDIVFAVQWGKKFLRMLEADGRHDHITQYCDRFPIRVLNTNQTAPVQLGAVAPAPPVSQDPDAEQILEAVRGRIPDGVAIWRAVKSGNHDAWLDSQPGDDKQALKLVAKNFADYCDKKLDRMFTRPDSSADSAWLKNHLEYQFAVGGQPGRNDGQTVLRAEQYQEGHLDWYSFDSVTRRSSKQDAEPAPSPLPEQVESFLPARVRFKGQPQTRFWEMEETQTDFGKIETSTTGLLHLMLAEFGLIYSNDWFMLPHPMDINTVCEIRGILVDDTFGRHTFIRPAGQGPETAWQRWAMFHLTERETSVSAKNRFYLAPAVGKILEGEPIERVNFIRDEMANMVWAIESIVPSQTGRGMRPGENDRPSKAPEQDAGGAGAKIAYVLGTTVPKNWTPFVPVRIEGSTSEIRLQRARMVGGEAPRGRLLREAGSPYFVEEEEVPRAGVYVERAWQRARWIGGRTFIWVGRRKTAGRGEGSSQLLFDQIVDQNSSKAK